MRRFALQAALSLSLVATAIGADLWPTPAQPKGPFYPESYPAESDPDLSQYAGARAQGEVLLLSGRVLRTNGAPIAGARVEIWQTNAFGRYHHPKDTAKTPLDPGFQGWGEMNSTADGSYRFQTVRPAAYTERAAHIHIAITPQGERTFYTQVYFADAPENDIDFLYRRLSYAQQERITLRPTGRPLAARFDVIVP